MISFQHETATPTSQKYFESMLRDLTLQWKHIYTLPCITTTGYKLRCFQNKILHNTLNFNQKLFCFDLEEHQLFIFLFTSKTKRLWCTVIEYFKRNLHIPLLSPQSAIFGFLEADDKVFLIINQVLLLFK